MNSYNSIIILHATDKSTLFLNKFKEEFNSYYYSFTSDKSSISDVKILLDNLKPKSLIIYLGHGSSSGLYEPDDTHGYEKYFLDATCGNHYFEGHDLFLLTCKSNEYLRKVYTSNYSVGFGNIISSITELEFDNKYNDIKKLLSVDEISVFNEIYVDISIGIIKSLINDKIYFQDIPKYFRFYINKKINEVLLNKKDKNRIEFARLLFEFRNQIELKLN